MTFGIVALLQIRKTGQRGKGLAVAGLVLTAVWIAGIATVVATGALNDDPVRNEAGEITRSERVSAFALAAGDCVNDVHMLNVQVVPCAEPHQGQVYAVVALALADDWPGAEAVAAEVDQSCLDELADFSPVAFDDETVEIYYYYPNRATWLAGGREATCIAYFADGRRTGSLVG